MAHVNVGDYRPAGPTISRFHASNAMVRLTAGPVGSGKTTAACWEAIFTTMLQTPSSDGVRRAKTGMLRDTYRNLYGTTLETHFKSFPRELGHFTGSDDRPFSHELSFPAPLLGPDGQPTREWGKCELTIEGRALGTHSVEATCRGWELMMAYIDEIDLCPPETIPFMLARTMRGGEVRTRRSRGVIGTFNKPDIDHWLYVMCVEDPMAGMEFFDQPAGLLTGLPLRTNPAAENISNLDENYYIIAATGQPEWYVRRMLRNEWGASVAGEPIYPGFDDRLHMSPVELQPEPRSLLTFGLDGGGTPAAVITGRQPNGRRIIYAELVLTDPGDPRGKRLAHGVGPRRFGQALDGLIKDRFRSNRFELGWCDPAAFFGADREAGEYSWPETVSQIVGIPIQPAPSNEIDLRLDAVRGPLYELNAFDGKPNLIINPSCRWTRRGFVADYKWEERDPKQPGKTLKPQKSSTSHVHDAIQYDLLGDIGRAGVTGGSKWDHLQVKRPIEGAAYDGPGEHPWRDRQIDQRYSQAAAGPAYQTDFDLWRS